MLFTHDPITSVGLPQQFFLKMSKFLVINRFKKILISTSPIIEQWHINAST